ncbi:hypothetical protein CKY47_10195 [Saccharothrix yanglingensis]|uniref:Uncharacterized protein n=1 Tax=Saccharothrix yanglingensis TaxID=659496 RepID=A0ABU0WWW1_9PSEU|nr:hypothetical protein [Saccharothrix yanglingensis]
MRSKSSTVAAVGGHITASCTTLPKDGPGVMPTENSACPMRTTSRSPTTAPATACRSRGEACEGVPTRRPERSSAISRPSSSTPYTRFCAWE